FFSRLFGLQSCQELFSRLFGPQSCQELFQSSFRSAKWPEALSVVFSVCKVAGTVMRVSLALYQGASDDESGRQRTPPERSLERRGRPKTYQEDCADETRRSLGAQQQAVQ